jgi:hypothetical protein
MLGFYLLLGRRALNVGAQQIVSQLVASNQTIAKIAFLNLEKLQPF